jgi:hypothetical protein
MLESKVKEKTKEFVMHIEFLAHRASDRLVHGFRGEETEKQFLQQIIADTWHLFKHNEWVIGLENLISNLHEVDFKIDDKAIRLAKESIEACGLNYNDWRFIEGLRK